MNYSPFLAKTSPFPVDISIDHAKGNFFYDKSGKKYIDFISGIGVSYIGHNNPDVVNAIKSQLDHYMHVMVYGEFDYPIQAKYARTLIGLLENHFNQVFFTNSGTEANEGAIKLAKRATGRTKIVACHGAYHGSTQGSLSLAGNEGRKRNFRPLIPDVYFMEYNRVKDLNIIDKNTAAVIIEPIQGDAGVRIPDKNWMIKLREICNKTGALLIFDEIQTGFGRTGKWFAFQQYETVPDIITLGKALGGGLPLGAFVADKGLMELLTDDPPLGHITTYGGNPVSCAAGQASVDFVNNEQLIDQVEDKGSFLQSILKHPEIIDVRRIGLMIAVELKNEKAVQKLVESTIKDGVLIYWFLSTRNSFRIAPPLTITKKEIQQSVDVILSNLDTI